MPKNEPRTKRNIYIYVRVFLHGRARTNRCAHCICIMYYGMNEWSVKTWKTGRYTSLAPIHSQCMAKIFTNWFCNACTASQICLSCSSTSATQGHNTEQSSAIAVDEIRGRGREVPVSGNMAYIYKIESKRTSTRKHNDENNSEGGSVEIS